jgi:hypothetical protein
VGNFLNRVFLKRVSLYQELAFEIKQQLQLNKIIVIPLASSAVGGIPNMFNWSLTNLNLPLCLLSPLQTVVVLKTCSIMREFLNDEVHLSDEEADNP